MGLRKAPTPAPDGPNPQPPPAPLRAAAKRTCSVRVAGEFLQMWVQGRMFGNGHTITVTKGIPEGSVLVGARMEAGPGPPVAVLTFEHDDGEIADGASIEVEFTESRAVR